jgi:hypothetical protein
MAISWATETFSSETKSVPELNEFFGCNGTVLSAHKCTEMTENGYEETRLHARSTIEAGLQTGFDTMFDNTVIPKEEEHIQ